MWITCNYEWVKNIKNWLEKKNVVNLKILEGYFFSEGEILYPEYINKFSTFCFLE